jgi:hypothetical protein
MPRETDRVRVSNDICVQEMNGRELLIYLRTGIKGDAVTGKVSFSVLYDTQMYALPTVRWVLQLS